MGSFESIKKYLNSDKNGEINFFKKFLNEIMDETYEMNFEFEVLIDTQNIREIEKDLKKIISSDIFSFDGDTLYFKFKDVIDIFTSLRNRYFHMLLGQGKDNFFNLAYDKNEIFRNLNPIFLNWISMIYVKIIRQGLLLYT